MPAPATPPVLLEGRKLGIIRPMGRNRMGKTTLVGRGLARRGEVLLEGCNAAHASALAIAQRGIAYVREA